MAGVMSATGDHVAGSNRGEVYLGLISGTSADGIDVALVEFAPPTALASASLLPAGSAHHSCSLLLGRTVAWEPELRTRLIALGQDFAPVSIDELGGLDVRVGEAFAAAALQVLHEAGIASTRVRALGSHGQTLRHRPGEAHPFTWQLGDAHVIAERTGITTIADFRRRDMAAGGQGAPLVPAFHAALLRANGEDRAVLNLGGIANLTLLPAHGDVRGFDTGPANALMDVWCERETGAGFDADGAFAARGQVDDELLARLLAEPWFALPPPKSTGREQFHLEWLRAQLRGNERPEDVQASLLEVSARTVAAALQATQSQTTRLLVCGGGVHNPRLLQRIEALLPGCVLESTAAHGLDPDFVEAMAFAWLARETLAGRPGNLPAVTGAYGLRVLGSIYPA